MVCGKARSGDDEARRHDYTAGGLGLDLEQRMSFLREFRNFAMRGNVFDLAVGVVLGGAFGRIVTAMVDGLIMPVVGVLVGGVNFTDLVLTLREAEGDAPAVVIRYGAFIQTVVDFVIIAFAIFLFVRGMSRLRRKEAEAPAPPPEPSAEVKLLTEIRDALRSG